MGQTSSKQEEYGDTQQRTKGITGGGTNKMQNSKPHANLQKAQDSDYEFIKSALRKLLLFQNLNEAIERKIVAEMYIREAKAGEILIKEGDTGIAASELYVVQAGKFEVLQNRHGVLMKVNTKVKGDCFGEISLMYNSPRTATVAAEVDSSVWVLERDVYRFFVRENVEQDTSQIELFLNSVNLLSSLSRQEKLTLVDAFEEVQFTPGTKIITQGSHGDIFYIIKEGEAAVFQQTDAGAKKVNHLFKADFFGEMALLNNAPRAATVEAMTKLTCLALARNTFIQVLGPLQEIMLREKSEEQSKQRLNILTNKLSSMPATVIIKRAKNSSKTGGQDLIRAKGHQDEVKNLLGISSDMQTNQNTLTLIEGDVVGGGAFSRISIVTEESSGRTYALKRLRKSAVVQCPEHIFCEQAITKNMVHPFCIRQYASFQDRLHLYFLFDLMQGGDLMDVLVAEARVIKLRVSKRVWQYACLAPLTKLLKGMEEPLARFYIAQIVLALEYLHSQQIVYRDLKPENVFVDSQGYIKLGDFGFAKELNNNGRTYTFCGTPGYVAPENVLAHGYNYSVDWWGLGVLLYVLLTGRQPFSTPKTDDPMVVMKRIVDDNWPIKYPPYLSATAKDLISRLLERRPRKRLGVLAGRTQDVKNHKWFEGMQWEALAARKLPPPRKPQNDQQKRISDLRDQEIKSGQKEPRETREELQECEVVFADF